MRRQDRQNSEERVTKRPKKCVVNFFCFCAYSRFVWGSRLTRWIHGKRESFLWGAGGAVALAVILLSCSTTSRTILAPPSIPGAEFVGSEECATCHEEIVRDFRTATHARLQTKKLIVTKSSAKSGGETKKSPRTWVASRATDRGVCTSKLAAKRARSSIRESRRTLVSSVTWKFARRFSCLIIIRCWKAR